MKKIYFVVAAILLSLIQGCTAMKPSTSYQCASSVANASYVGLYKGVENNLGAADIAQDLYCADLFKTKKYPKGFVAIYGSSRIYESNNQKDPLLKAANDKLYNDIKIFANTWTRQYSSKYPIMTGAGPGLMEAGNRGAKEAGGPSIGYATYYGPAPRGDASKAFQKYKPANGNEIDIIDDGLIFSSVAIRESAMILHSAAIIIAPGGTGTEWEIFQIIETIKSDQLKPVPIYLFGDKELHWKSFYERLDDMILRGTIKKDEVTKHFVHVDNPQKVFDLLKIDLRLN